MGAFDGGLDKPFERLSDRLGGGVLGQVFNPGYPSVPATVPPGAEFAFIEAIGHGGNISTSSSLQRTGGGAGEDAIVAVAVGDVLTSTTAYGAPSTITRGGTTLLSAASNGSQNIPDGALGKYPGASASSSVGGRGGGRLGGPGGTTGTVGQIPGLGAGTAGTTIKTGGSGATSITFFASYDEALAYAKAVYGGVWTP